ncbi:MAG: FAD-binding protein, partial [Candidatus Bathyarchaeia archaeon]
TDNLGAETIMVCKGQYGASGCTPNSASEWMAYGVALGITDPRDSCEAHFHDIVKTGAYVCDQNLARIIGYEAPDRFHELVEWGVKFLRQPDGRFRQFMSDGAAYARACGTGADTGKQIMNALRKVVKERGIRVIENMMAVDLIKTNGAVVGALGIDINTLETTVFLAKSTVIATGGHGQLFSHNVFPPRMTGDGYAMALRAGASLVNMEFMQIGPCVVTPFKFDVGGVLWRLGPRLLNGKGVEYLTKYLPKGLNVEEVYRLKSLTFPFTMRNASGYIDIANYTEIVEGMGTKNQCVYFDLSHIPRRAIEEQASIPLKFFHENGVDIREEPLEIAPALQHMNGGALINERAETGVLGLYAAGEVAGGQHGADRPGGNSLADCQVFGARAGRYAAERSKTVGMVANRLDVEKLEEDIRSLSKLRGRYDVETLRNEVKRMMWRNVLVVRQEKTLNETFEKLLRYQRIIGSQLNVDKEYLIEALELRNMVEAGLAIVKSALTRKETRGSHYRADYPQRNDKEWLKIIEVQYDSEGLSLRLRRPNMILHP